jgi:hypothetical protein
MDRAASPWKEAMTAARKRESGRENVNGLLPTINGFFQVEHVILFTRWHRLGRA